MSKTRKNDLLFMIVAALLWMFALSVTAADFIYRQKKIYRFGLLNLAGLLAFIGGVAIRLQCRRTLGKHFSLHLRLLGDHHLVQHGIYRHVRHPAYTGDLIAQIGIPLMIRSVPGSLVMLLLIPPFIYRIGVEEAMLTDQFGDEYRNYARNSKKLIPFIF